MRLALRDLTIMVGDQCPQREANQNLAGGENNWIDEIRDLYYNPSGETAFSTYKKLLRKAKTLQGAEPIAIKPWLE